MLFINKNNVCMCVCIIIIIIHYFYYDIYLLFFVILYYFLCLCDLRDLRNARFVLPFLPPLATLVGGIWGNFKT